MSHKATYWAFQQKLPALQKLVLIVLADRHNGDSGRCDPSLNKVAEDCGMSKDSVRDAIKALQEKGLIVAHQRFDGSVQLTNFYTFDFSKKSTPPVANSHPSTSPQPLPPVANSHPNKEVEPVTEPFALNPPTEIPPKKRSRKVNPDDAVRDEVLLKVWDYYKKEFGRNGGYLFSDTRRNHGEKGWTALKLKCRAEDVPEEDQPGAILDMFCDAVDAMKSNAYHNGQNEHRAMYNDWEDLFAGGQRHSPDKLTDYWLNENKSPTRRYKS